MTRARRAPQTTIRAQFVYDPPAAAGGTDLAAQRRRWPLYLAIGLLTGIVLMVAGALIASMMRSSNGSAVAKREATEPTPARLEIREPPRPQPTVETSPPPVERLCARSYRAEALRVVYCEFRLAERSLLQGKIWIAGGQDNNIDVHLRGARREYYSRRDYRSATLSVVLEPGDYRISFDNTFEPAYSKQITAQLTATRMR